MTKVAKMKDTEVIFNHLQHSGGYINLKYSIRRKLTDKSGSKQYFRHHLAGCMPGGNHNNLIFHANLIARQ
jgi:hypothetical protein